jgi:hypothetical protein
MLGLLDTVFTIKGGEFTQPVPLLSFGVSYGTGIGSDGPPGRAPSDGSGAGDGGTHYTRDGNGTGCGFYGNTYGGEVYGDGKGSIYDWRIDRQLIMFRRIA